MPVPPWLEDLRRAEVVRPVLSDMRTIGNDLLGVSAGTAFRDVICGGQADFDAPWNHLSADDRVLLYAYLNQTAHIEELTEAFQMLFARSAVDGPVVFDLGCGPFTGGLALATSLAPGSSFTYIGMDRAAAMRRFGAKLAAAALPTCGMANIACQWVDDLDRVVWEEPPRWRPVIVIVSYLLASATLNPIELVAQVTRLLQRIGRGPVMVLYTNSVSPWANRTFPLFRAALEAVGFVLVADNEGEIRVKRYNGPQTRRLRYALFQRGRQRVLHLVS